MGWWSEVGVANIVRIGIDNNCARREKSIRKSFIDIPIIVLKKYNFEHYWQAELIENLMRRRLKKWVIPGTHEWVGKEMSMQGVFDFLKQNKDIFD